MIARTDRKNVNTLPLKKATGPAAPEAAPKAAATGRMASDSSTLPAADARDALNDYSRFKEDQGSTNGCGTTSLAALLSFWKGVPGAYTREKIDKDIRRANMFTSPSNIVKYAREQGFRSEMRNNGSIEELKKYTEMGVPVQVLFEPRNEAGNDKDFLLHYVTVTGFKKGPDGKELVLIADPNDPTGSGQREMPIEDFKAQWGNLKVGAGPLSVPSGFNNLMLVHLPKENVPIKGADGKVRNSNDIALPKHEGAGIGGFLADKLADVVNFGAKAVDTVKEGFKKVGKFLSKL